MAELIVVRHGQASFGADNYDQLSELGERQSAAAGDMLRQMGWVPDRVITGTLLRQKQTLAHMGFGDSPEEHAGWNEYNFHNLLDVQFGGEVPIDVQKDRKTHFRTLRNTILDWQAGGLTGAIETYAEFAARVEAARAFSASGGDRVLVVSSGGAIGQLVSATMQAPPAQMIALNLQVKNSSMTKFIFAPGRFFLHEFNATPHFATPEGAALLSYS